MRLEIFDKRRIFIKIDYVDFAFESAKGIPITM